VCYSLWYNAPMMLPAGGLEAEEPIVWYGGDINPLEWINIPCTKHLNQPPWVPYTTSCKHSLMILKMGKIMA